MCLFQEVKKHYRILARILLREKQEVGSYWRMTSLPVNKMYTDKVTKTDPWPCIEDSLNNGR